MSNTSENNNALIAKVTSLKSELRGKYKRRKTFKRHHSDRYARVPESWRRPRGLDNRVRKKHRGSASMPTIFFRTPKIVRDVLPNGMYNVNVSNVDELKTLQCVNGSHCVTICKSVGARKRIAINEEARKLGITITNKDARIAEAIIE